MIMYGLYVYYFEHSWNKKNDNLDIWALISSSQNTILEKQVVKKANSISMISAVLALIKKMLEYTPKQS